jgi:hypothetical protein
VFPPNERLRIDALRVEFARLWAAAEFDSEAFARLRCDIYSELTGLRAQSPNLSEEKSGKMSAVQLSLASKRESKDCFVAGTAAQELCR